VGAGVVFGLVQLGVSSWFGPQLADILAALATMGALVMVLRFRRPAGEAGMLARFTGGGVESSQAAIPFPAPVPGRRAMLFAWMPYGLLVGCVLLWGWGPWQRAMSALTLVLRWPGLDDVVRRMPPIVAAPSAYHARFTLNWLAAAGTACMAATLLSVAWLRLCGRLKAGQFVRILGGVARQLRLPTAIVTTVLGIAFLMNYCGATATLGLGFAATGRLFPLFSALLGWVGVFLTGSDTSANALFGNLQVVTAGRLGFDPVLMAAANSSGGVMGKMISLQTIAIAAAATGLSAGEQVKLFRLMLRHSLVLALLTGAVVLGYAYVLRVG
jgi:lactate permease